MVLYSLLTPFALAVLGYSINKSALFSRASICATIQDKVLSGTKVYFPTLNESKYLKGIHHWAGSSTQEAECVVEPGTTSDVAAILKILGKTRTPFAVKGGGHATNPGFSSTTGIHIVMSRFSDIDYNEARQTVAFRAGLVWDDVYAALEPHGVSVLGGHVTGVGVAGFTLGGGYSWKTNQHGLAIDTVVAFELMKPDGTVHNVTNETQPDLFFGLKGGFNNFGIVTKFTLKTFLQTQVWGGLIVAAASEADQVAKATADFSVDVKDPKAQIITAYNFNQGAPLLTLQLFYDAPNPPSSLFDKFMNISFLAKDVKTRDFLELVQSIPTTGTANQRAIYCTTPILDYTPSFLDAVLNETSFWGQEFLNEAETVTTLS